ncbi:hypothetical protein [Bergeyella zoohelcum]|uniref:Uncharacterized protein n=1 Tax=Bergeyella zoohelcum TaxID=1015 RepID=A0A380ZU99_9FLAO|nr:hypothetical protein [Bergeyella zoohelcum]EKB59064.1 hypothetical protein HMPREF9700_01541 [Bergeyella zoohelcum CCUG 30536]SUV52575.1 Uncharacterised protein [Bergeyella zoohelcum]
MTPDSIRFFEKLWYSFRPKYIHGIPNYDTPTTIVFEPHKEGIAFLDFNNENKKFFFIDRKNIKNVSVEDETSIEKRIGFKRLLLVGIFAIAWRKKQVNPLSFLIFEYVDDVGLTQEMYIQSEEKNGIQSFNNIKYNLYKFWKEADENPNFDKILEQRKEHKKQIEKAGEEFSKKYSIGCFIILAVIVILFIFWFLN